MRVGRKNGVFKKLHCTLFLLTNLRFTCRFHPRLCDAYVDQSILIDQKRHETQTLVLLGIYIFVNLHAYRVVFANSPRGDQQFLFSLCKYRAMFR